MSKLSLFLKDLFFPRDLTCIRCGRELTDAERAFSACENCSKTLVKCEKQDDSYFNKDYPFVKLVTLYAYTGLPKYIVLNAKDFGKPYLTEYEARFFASGMKEYGIYADYITFIASNDKVRKRRGYDPMLLVAKELSCLTAIPAISCFKRSNDSIDLTKLEIAERECEAEKAYSCIMPENSLKGKRILIIDDVITTGSTAKACLKALDNAGYESAVFMTFTKGIGADYSVGK